MLYIPVCVRLKLRKQSGYILIFRHLPCMQTALLLFLSQQFGNQTPTKPYITAELIFLSQVEV